MQIAIYHWWTASNDDAYEDSRLVYIARDTGRYAEYLVRTVEEPAEDEGEPTIHIEYRPWHPYKGAWKRVPYTINQILNTYKATQLAVDSGRIPPRDFDLKWSDERLERAYQAGELGKTDKDKYEKAKARKDFNAWVDKLPTMEPDQILDNCLQRYCDLLAPQKKALDAFWECKVDDELPKLKAKAVESVRKTKRKKELQQLEKGDWNCRFCKFSPICYSNGDPKEI